MITKLSGLVAALAVVGSFVVAGASAADATDPETQRILAPAGKLRVGLYPGTPTSILPDAQSGGPRGVGYDLVKEVARRLGVAFEPVVFSKNAEVLEAVKTGGVDMVFTNASAARAKAGGVSSDTPSPFRKAGIRAGRLWRNSPRMRSRKVWLKRRLRVPDCAGPSRRT